MSDKKRPTFLALAARLEAAGMPECEAIRAARAALFPEDIKLGVREPFWKMPTWPDPKEVLNKAATERAQKLDKHNAYEHRCAAALSTVADSL